VVSDDAKEVKRQLREIDATLGLLLIVLLLTQSAQCIQQGRIANALERAHPKETK
jgi:hypothetical protein